MEELRELPKGWAWTGLINVVDDVEKVNPKNSPDKEIIYIDIASIDNKNQKIIEPKLYLGKDAPSRARQLIKAGDILFSTVRTYLKNIANVDQIFDRQIASTGFCVIRPSNLINKKLLFYLVQTDSFLNPLNQIQRGTSYPAVRDSDVFSQFIPVAPLREQHHIVAKIEELFTNLDAGVEYLEKIKAQLKRYRQAVLKHAFEGKLTEEWREANKDKLEPASVLLERIRIERKRNSKGKIKELQSDDIYGLHELPEGWCWAIIPEIGELNRGKSKHRPRNDQKLFGGKYPFIQTGDIKKSNGLVTQYSQTYNEFGLKQSHLWPIGTLCITIAANIAETALLGIEACSPDSVVGFEANKSICEVKYIHFYFKTIKNRLESFAPATAQKNINLDTLNNVVVPLPSFYEQKKIVNEIERYYSIADEVEKTVEQSLKQSERLRQSILKKAFEGKLVPQDPSDEPAEKLLERIIGEKTVQKSSKYKEFKFNG
jgi:type I restriction enzyme S subunit